MVPRLLLAVLASLVLALVPVRAATSDGYAADPLTATLITAEDGVAPDATTVSAGLRLELNGDWKAYWRTPGEVGMAPRIDWSGSTNVAEARVFWPAPSRFRAFGIENYGYKGEVVLPLEIVLERAGEPAALSARVDLLVCETICIPEAFALELDLPAGEGIDRGAAALIGEWAMRVPGSEGAQVTAAALTADALVVEVKADHALASPDIFPEFADGAFGEPDLRLAEDGRVLWASLPLASRPTGAPQGLTLTDGSWAATVPLTLSQAAPVPPHGERTKDGAGGLLVTLGLALLGGLILNVMPCVLPVLAIKLTGAIKLHAADGAHVRRSFLASAAGVIAFMLVLALGVLTVRAAGGAVGWGVQFQSPAFLATLVLLLMLFAANMAGLFEIALPVSWQTAMTRWSGGDGTTSLVPDFLTGAFAALLATPCSAPFLGTAVAFALGGSTLDVLLIFAALGLGLAAPYLLVAARPSLVRLLPRPGRWMSTIKAVLAAALLGTAIWLVWILAGVAGPGAALATLALAALAALVPAIARGTRPFAMLTLASLAALAVVVPTVMRAPASALAVTAVDTVWQPFDRAAIGRRVALGEVVFVDVTADWCLTCKANKAATLDRGPVASLLASNRVVAMRADWTRPDETIRLYLRAHDRYGIPFNIVYGPAAPDGIALPEILTERAVLDAVERAGRVVEG